MQKEFTYEFLGNYRGCYSLEKLNNCSFILNLNIENNTVSLIDILNSEIKFSDKLYFLGLITNKTERFEIGRIIARIDFDNFKIYSLYEMNVKRNEINNKKIEAIINYINNL